MLGSETAQGPGAIFLALGLILYLIGTRFSRDSEKTRAKPMMEKRPKRIEASSKRRETSQQEGAPHPDRSD